MTEYDALHRAILDDPADDTARLAFADYLDENPTPARRARAEFIRLQVGRQGLGPAAVAASLKREEAILKKWGQGWLPKGTGRRGRASVRSETVTCHGVLGGNNDAHTFERGFVSRVRYEATADRGDWPFLATLVRQAFAAHPIEVVTLAVADHEPEVRVTFSRDQLDDNNWWVKIYHIPPAADILGDDDRWLEYQAFGTRRQACALLPDILPFNMPTFRPVPVEIPF